MKWLTTEKLSMLSPGHEPTVYEYSRRTGRVPKKAKGGQLTDYSAVEILHDLKVELGKHNANIERIFSMTIYLRSLINA